MRSVTRDLVMLLLLTGVGAAWLLVHFALLMRVLRSSELPRWLRLLAWVPPVTPIAGWSAGARQLSALWAAVGVAYWVLRGLA
jgi:hypothetical protein